MWFQHSKKEINKTWKTTVQYLTVQFPVTGKIFERILYYNMYEIFTENNSISPNESGFKLRDSCIHQLLSITHEIHKSFGNGLEVWSILLEISKAFDKEWHKRVLYKLNGVSGKLFDIITVFLDLKKQRIVFNGQYFSWTSVESGVPQGSIFGSLLFFIYINGLSGDLTTNAQLFGDDTSLFSIVHNMNTSTINLSNDLNKIKNGANQCKINLISTLANKLRGLHFQASFKRKIIIKFIWITSPLNKFTLKNILQCILILN